MSIEVKLKYWQKQKQKFFKQINMVSVGPPSVVMNNCGGINPTSLTLVLVCMYREFC